LAKALQEGFVYSGQYSSFRRRQHGSSSKHLPPSKFIIFSQNHDQVGNRLKGERLSTLVSFEALKLAAGIVLLSPNIPLLFMGEEYGEEAPFLYFVSHSDQELIDDVRRGRKEEFSAFQSEGEVPDPQDEATFLRSKVDFDLYGHGKHKILLDFYKVLITLRKQIPSLFHLNKTGMEVKVIEGSHAVSVLRRYEDDRTCSIFNFDSRPVGVKIFIENGYWKKLLDSSSEEWNGPGSSMPQSIQSIGSEISIDLNPHSFLLYRSSAGKGLSLEGA
jgi:maltooligosyltrehalose trehalohydrolase